MAFLTLKIIRSSGNNCISSNSFKYQDLITEENIVLVKGRISVKEEEEPKIICEEIADNIFLNLQKDGEVILKTIR